MSALVAPLRDRPRQSATQADLLVALSDKAFVALVFAAIAAYFLLSDMTLVHLGVNYAGDSGNAIEKIHPGTWLSLLAAFHAGVRRGNPFRLIDIIARYRGATLFLASWLLLVIWVTAITKIPFTPLIDTFFSAILVFTLIGELDATSRRRLALLAHGLLALNASIGVIEYLTGWRLTPYSISGEVVEYDWRSTALFGHPLGNAALTGSYIVALAVGGAGSLPSWLRAPAFALQLMAMVAFGGRASLGTSLAIVVGVAAVRLLGLARGARFDRLSAAVVFLVAPLIVAAVGAAAAGGYFSQFIDRINDDAGSAQTRLVMLRFFEIIPLRDLLFGPDPAYLASLRMIEGVELGIESFFVGFLLEHGVIMACMFFVGLFAFCWQIVRVTRPSTSVVLAFYFFVAAGSVSLSVKTISFAIFTAMTLAVMYRNARHLPVSDA